MKLLTLVLMLISITTYADEISYSCVSDTNLELFSYGDSDELIIVANSWGGGYYHILREDFPIFLNPLSQHGKFSLSTEGFGGAKKNTLILLYDAILNLKDEDTYAVIFNPEIGEQLYFCVKI